VVVGERRINLRPGHGAELPHDFLGNQTHVVPLSDLANGDTGTGDARPAAANFGTSGDQAAYLVAIAIDFEYNAGRRASIVTGAPE
jgi:hypothetical protein